MAADKLWPMPRCKRCGHELRAVMPNGKDWLLVCDRDSIATIAPASMSDFLVHQTIAGRATGHADQSFNRPGGGR